MAVILTVLSFILGISVKQLIEWLARKLRALIRELVNEKVDVNDFCDRFEKAVNSNSPRLAGLVKEVLGNLRQPIVTEENTAENDAMKVKTFLIFLLELELSAKENERVGRNVQALIQDLVDGKVTAEEFCDGIQKEVNSQPNPLLTEYLKTSLPKLKELLASNKLTIDGIRPPSLSSVAQTDCRGEGGQPPFFRSNL